MEEEAHAEAEAQKEEDEGEVQVNYTLLFYKVSYHSVPNLQLNPFSRN